MCYYTVQVEFRAAFPPCVTAADSRRLAQDEVAEKCLYNGDCLALKTFKDLLSIVSPARRRVVPGSDVFFITMSAADELDPSEFVQRIRQLGEQRDQQDAERVRKLEEEIIQGRSERLARRAGEYWRSNPCFDLH